MQPDGTYEPVVKLGRSHRTIVLPSPIVLDTKPPTVTVKHPQYPLLSPDGDGRRDSFRVAYKLSEPAHAILAVRGRRVLFTKGQKTTGELVWDGRVKNSQGQLVQGEAGPLPADDLGAGPRVATSRRDSRSRSRRCGT